MAESDKPAHFIDLKLSERLKDPKFRKQFFLAEASAKIASQIIALRKKRGKSQSDVAEMVGTRQPAISRVEQADYQNWSFSTLRSIADALDARIRVLIEPLEDIIGEYESSGKPSERGDAVEMGPAARAAAEANRRFLHDAQPTRQMRSVGDLSSQSKGRYQ